jgi:hypothetical protein
VRETRRLYDDGDWGLQGAEARGNDYLGVEGTPKESEGHGTRHVAPLGSRGIVTRPMS